MCSRLEAEDREHCAELSPFERLRAASAGTPAVPYAIGRRRRPRGDPWLVVKKYRRSAAGGGTATLAGDSTRDGGGGRDGDPSRPRSLEGLEASVVYLLGSVMPWQRPPSSLGGDGPSARIDDAWGIPGDGDSETPFESERRFSLSETVAFVDDRLRAVQKDLVMLLGGDEDDFGGIGDGRGDVGGRAGGGAKIDRSAGRRVRAMQARMVRHGVLSSYLLSDAPREKYEAKFGARALGTALAAYLDLSSDGCDDDDDGGDGGKNREGNCGAASERQKIERRTKDEMMAYAALLHSNAVIRANEQAIPPPTPGETTSLVDESGRGWGALLAAFRKRTPSTGDLSSARNYPRWRWALDLACAADGGNHRRYFRLFEEGPGGGGVDNGDAADEARFLLMGRCIASRSLNLIRLAAVRRCNRAYGKAEAISGANLARMLRFGGGDGDGEGVGSGGAGAAAKFCQDAGLPVREGKCGDGAKVVVFKSAPISISGNEAVRRMCDPGRASDAFVFGPDVFGYDSNGGGSADALGLVNGGVTVDADRRTGGIGDEDVDDWEDRDGVDENDGREGGGVANGKTNHFFQTAARIDEDGVLIPPSRIIWNLIQ